MNSHPLLSVTAVNHLSALYSLHSRVTVELLSALYSLLLFRIFSSLSYSMNHKSNYSKSNMIHIDGAFTILLTCIILNIGLTLLAINL